MKNGLYQHSVLNFYVLDRETANLQVQDSTNFFFLYQ